jgi:nicotinamidase-related amidase
MNKLNALLFLAVLFFGPHKTCSELKSDQTIQSPDSILLVIDMQTGLLDTNRFMHVDKTMTNELIRNVNQNINKARELNIPIVYIKHECSNPVINFFTGDNSKKGSKQTEIDNRITIFGTSVFTKTVPNAFSNKSFCSYIEENRIGTLFIEGIFAEHCVYATGKAGLDRKLEVVMLEDAIGSSSAKTKLKFVEKYKAHSMVLQKQL